MTNPTAPDPASPLPCDHFIVRMMGNAGPSGFQTTHAECAECGKRLSLEEVRAKPLDAPREVVVTEEMVRVAVDTYRKTSKIPSFDERMRLAIFAALEHKS
jgi:hypothetical protein